MVKMTFFRIVFTLGAFFVGGLCRQVHAGENGSGYFYYGIGTGADLPGSQWNADDYVGAGAQVLGGYQVDPNWAGQLDVQEWIFAGGGNSLYNLRVLAEAKYTFEGQGPSSASGPGWQPYLLAGPGMVFQSLSPSGDSTANFDVLGGVGIQADLAPRTRWFLQAEANFIVSQTTTFTDVPISTGLWVEF